MSKGLFRSSSLALQVTLNVQHIATPRLCQIIAGGEVHLFSLRNYSTAALISGPTAGSANAFMMLNIPGRRYL